MGRWIRWVAFAAFSICVAPVSAQAPAASPADLEFFEKQIRPILAENCYGCHSAKAENLRGLLRLDSRKALTDGGSRGKAIVPGDPANSRLIQAVQYQDPQLMMPPKGRLPAEKIDLLKEWVKRGAAWPADPKGLPGASSKHANTDIVTARKGHWSFKPLTNPVPPKVANTKWVITPIDRFILAKLEQQGIRPAKPTDRRTLIRRATFDLTGLPPTPAEVSDFLNDKSPNAWEKVIDRLLASPAYGERWGRHWLDLVRYAETDGHEFDFEKPTAYEYRDYVIRALNADVPYNQFLVEHIAGDLMPKPRIDGKDRFNESIIATGFWFLGEGKHSPVDLLVDEAERVDNQIDVLGKGILGLTLGCARCHDHKFDPITTKDYYALSGIIKSSRQQDYDVTSAAKLGETVKALRDRTEVVLNGPIGEFTRKRRAEEATKTLAMLQAVREAGLTADNAALDRVAEERRLDRVKLQSLAKHLREVSVNDPTDRYHVWATVACNPKSSTDAGFQEMLTAAKGRVNSAKAAAVKDSEQSTRLAKFVSKPTAQVAGTSGYMGWYRTGDAFAPIPEASADRTRVAPALPTAVADSGALSERLAGTLRSETITLDKPFLWIRMSGKGPAKINLIVDNFQRIRDPLWGRLTITPASATKMTWQSINLDKFQGHKAYIEFIDPGDGWIAFDEVVLSDKRPADAPDETLVNALSAPMGSVDQLAAKLAPALTNPAAIEIANVDWKANEKESALPDHCRACVKDRNEIERSLPEPRMVMAIADGNGVDDKVHTRGSTANLGDVVPRRFLQVCAANMPAIGAATSGRMEIANRLIDPKLTPLVPRVMANRVWKHHFGEGIVRSTDDFGLMGQLPTNPQLLDWLAQELMRNGWSLKKLHRTIMLSQAYKMASVGDAKADAADPENKLFHKMPVQRLEAEAIRDSVLAVSGRLDRKLYGPSVMPYLTEFMDGRGRPDKSGPLDGDGRRSIYEGVRRNFLNPFFLAFDFPVPFATMGRRTVSNVPAQALAMMNNPLIVQQAEIWAKRVITENADATKRIESMYETALSRPPTAEETKQALDFVDQQKKTYTADAELQSWRDLCHVLFNVKEFVFLG